MTTPIIDRLGYYTVGGLHTYRSKIEALIEAKKTNSYVDWVFNDAILSKHDWTTPSTKSLNDVYKERALQLREKYDYLVLNYSGGSDSHNILHTFIDNGIKLDEVLIRWPRKRTQSIYTPNRFGSAYNQLSEWDLALAPDIQWLKTYHPEIHLEFYDYSDDTVDFFNSKTAENDPWFDVISGTQLSATHAVRWRTSLDRYKKMFHEKGVKGCQIFGTDKPRVCYNNGDFFTYYLDIIAGTPTHYEGYEDQYNALELFYWTPDMPDIVKVQSHKVMDFFKKNPALLPVIMPDAAKSYTLRNTYETLIRSIVYPKWDFNRFQAAKPAHIVRCEYDNWLFDSKIIDNKAMATWQYSIDYLEQNIDEKYIQRDHTGAMDSLAGMVTPFYKIGSNNVT